MTTATGTYANKGGTKTEDVAFLRMAERHGFLLVNDGKKDKHIHSERYTPFDGPHPGSNTPVKMKAPKAPKAPKAAKAAKAAKPELPTQPTGPAPAKSAVELLLDKARQLGITDDRIDSVRDAVSRRVKPNAFGSAFAAAIRALVKEAELADELGQ